MGVNMRNNLLAVWYRANEHDYSHGLSWYAQANHTAGKIAMKKRITTEQVCGVIAALSPGLNWDVNIDQAEFFISEWSAGATRGELLRLTVGSYGRRNRIKAHKILKGQDPMEVLGGNKVRSFYQNLIFPQSDIAVVCIDRHAKSAAFGVKLGDRASVVRPKEYPGIEKLYIACARDLGVLPQGFQAVVWHVWRRLSGVLDQQDLPF